MKKRSKLFAAILAACMVVTTIPTVAFAEETRGIMRTTGTLQSQIAAAGAAAKTIRVTTNTTESITIPNGANITLNIAKGATLTNTIGEDTITVDLGGKLTITGEGKVNNMSNGKGALFNNGTVTLNGCTFDRSLENGSNTTTSGGNSWYTICNHGTMTVNDGTTVQTAGNNSNKGKFSSLVENGYQNYRSSNPRIGYVNGTNAEKPSLTIEGGTFQGGLNTIKNDEGGLVTIKNGTFKNYYQNVVLNWNVTTISGGTFTAATDSNNTTCGIWNANYTGQGYTHSIGQLKISGGIFSGADYAVYAGSYDSNSRDGSIIISGGEFAGTDSSIGKAGDSNADIQISAGYFTSDPSAYLAKGKAAVASDKTGYVYMIGKVGTNPAEVAPADPEVKIKDGVGENVADEIEAALTSGTTEPSISPDVVDAAANTIANDNKTTTNEGKDALEDANVIVNEGDTVTIVIQPYLDIQIVDAEVTSGENSTITSFTLDITPMYRTVATTANLDSNEPIITKPVEGKVVNAVVIKDSTPLPIHKSVRVTVPLPSAFATYLSNNTAYVQHKGHEYVAEVYNDTYNSIATFINPHGFSKFTFTAASTAVAEIGEDSYTSLQAAVDAVKNGETITVLTENVLTATASGNKTFTIAGANITPNVTITAAPGYTITNQGNTYTVKKTGGGTTTPGDETCKKDSTCPISKFTDASPTAWYHDGVHYVLENSLMFGTGNNKFSPNATLTRAELAQILYNKAGKPAVTGASTFTDVPASAWYAKAVAWAQQNNIVSGVGGGKFAPNDKITREQIAVMLYNDAGKKAVTGTLNFKDAANVSDWAKDAMLWATQNKVINGAAQADGTLLLNPTNGATRAETAAMLANYYNK